MFTRQYNFVTGRAEEAPAAPACTKRLEFDLAPRMRVELLIALEDRLDRCAYKRRAAEQDRDDAMAAYWRDAEEHTRAALREFELYVYGVSSN